MGWIGDAEKLKDLLKRVGAERVGDHFKLHGPTPFFGLGGDEVVVQNNADVIVDGERVRVVDLIQRDRVLMGGVFCTVIGEGMEEHESPHAMPGGRCCMYCGTPHSTAIDCRLPCEEKDCTWLGVPWMADGKETAPRCLRHAPLGVEVKPLPVPPPKEDKS